MEKETMDLIAKIRDEEAANERAQIEQVFGLTGGELEESAWVPTYAGEFHGHAFTARPITFTYWYTGVPGYAAEDFEVMPTYRTVCRDEMFGQVPETVTDDEGTWKVVARYRTSGEVECPMFGEINTLTPCGWCDAVPGDFHGYIYIGDGWAEIVYRLEETDIGFTPDPTCDNCGGTGIFEVVNGEDIPCTFCLRDAIKRGEIEGTIGD